MEHVFSYYLLHETVYVFYSKYVLRNLKQGHFTRFIQENRGNIRSH